MATQFTTWAQVARRLSATGVDLRTDHSPDDAFDEANNAASLYVYGFLGSRYPLALLATSEWVSSVTADICIWYLEQMRLNPVSAVSDNRKEMWDKMLAMIQQNKMNIPDISIGADRPEVRNWHIDHSRYPAQRNVNANNTRYKPNITTYPDRTEPPLR